jgi:hypothetical protein
MSFLAVAVFFVLVAIAISLAVWVRWLWMHYPASHRSLNTWMLTTVVLLALGVCGMLVGLIKAFGAVGGESIDPSQKARVLAEGISEGMNCSVFGLLPLLVMPVVLVVLTWKYHWSKAKKTP